MRISDKLVIVVLSILLLVMPLLISCDDDEEETSPTIVPTDEPTASLTEPTESVSHPTTPVPQPIEDIVITIGNLSDMTGPAAMIMQTMNMVLDDLVEYYNEQNLIPGVELKIVSYDTQYDPAKAIPGYEWVREKGADLIFAIATPCVATLKARTNTDTVVLFGPTGASEDLTPPGYVFSLGSIPECDGYTLVKWIVENDPDFPQDRPAKIGGASWTDGYSDTLMAAMEEYAESHPDQYEWVGTYLTNFTFDWTPEVEALKDCDYVYTNTVMTQFAQQYRTAGYDAKFIGAVAHTAMLGQIDSADLWDEIDGTFILNTSRWWNDEGTIVDLSKDLLYQNHPDDAEKIIRSGSGYLGVHVVYQMLEIIRQAVEAVGPENFDSEALYDAAQSFSLTIDGVEQYSFTETKRASMNYMVILEAKGAEKDLSRVSEWVPIICTP